MPPRCWRHRVVRWDEGSGAGGFLSGAGEEFLDGDQGVAVGACAAGAEADGEGVAVIAALLAEVAGLAVGAGVDGVGASGPRRGSTAVRVVVGAWRRR